MALIYVNLLVRTSDIAALVAPLSGPAHQEKSKAETGNPVIFVTLRRSYAVHQNGGPRRSFTPRPRGRSALRLGSLGACSGHNFAITKSSGRSNFFRGAFYWTVNDAAA